MQVKPLSYADHGAYGWHATAQPKLRRDCEAIPVALDELAALALHMPVMVRVTGDLAEPAIPFAALQGIKPSLFGDGSLWQTGAVPVHLLHGPFQITPSPVGELVMVDPEGLTPLDSGQQRITPLFEDNKTVCDVTLARLSRLKAWRRSRIAARRAATGLLQAGCLTPWEDHEGWHQIAPDRLAALKPEPATILHKSGALRLATVIEVTAMHLAANAPAPAATAPAEETPPDPFLAALRGGF